MEKVDQRPEVWAIRRLMRRSCECEPRVLAYFLSKARVQTVTKRFLKNGQEVKEYQVEYETSDAIDEIGFDGDVYVETGEWVKVGRVFRNYIIAINHRELLNQKLVASRIANAPASMVDKIINDANRDAEFARKLEKSFDGIFLNDLREF